MTRATTAAMSLVTACCAALSLTACSGSDDTGAPEQSPASSSEAAGSEAPSPGGSSEVSATALCDYLSGRRAELEAIGSEVGAMANLTVNLYSWYEEQGAVPSGLEIDDQTEAQCPDVRAGLLELAGIESFAAL